MVLTASELAEGLGNCRGPASWLPPELGRGTEKTSLDGGKVGVGQQYSALATALRCPHLHYLRSAS